MKTIFLLRHAKSSWDDASLDDFDRPLAPRGDRSARLIGAYMAKLGLQPDLVLCSPALRTRSTWALVSECLAGGVPVQTPEVLYLAGSSAILELIQTTAAEVGRLMLIGHNPGMGELAVRLATDGPAQDIRALQEKYPTGALAEFNCDVDTWSQVEGGSLVRFVKPRDLEAD